MGAVKNDHKFDGLKEHKCIVLQLCRSDILPWSQWAKSKVPVAFLLDTLSRENLFPCCFQHLESLVNGHLLPSSKPATAGQVLLIWHHSKLFLLPPSYMFKDLCNYIGSTWIIQDNLPILRSLI